MQEEDMCRHSPGSTLFCGNRGRHPRLAETAILGGAYYGCCLIISEGHALECYFVENVTEHHNIFHSSDTTTVSQPSILLH
jgi:hypothetical protein